MTDLIDYKKLMHSAFRSVMVNALRQVAEGGLPGNHHFYISFNTGHPGVDMAQWLKDKFPGEMTIVMQEWFDNLSVTDDRFAVTLNFSDNPEPMVIPFDAVRSFADPSVEFGLRFDADEKATPSPDDPDPADDPADKDDDAHEVVSLDAFRKK